MLFALALSVGILALGIYVLVRHGDVPVAVGACVLAAATFGMWLVGSRQTDRLQEQLRESEERIGELETVPAQRGFSETVRAQLVADLSGFVGPTAFVLSNSSDLETTEYSREIVSILNDAGWEVPASFGMMYRPVLMPGEEAVPPGVVVGISSDVPDSFGNSIFNAFRDAGVDVHRGPHWPGTEHPISILVGPSR